MKRTFFLSAVWAAVGMMAVAFILFGAEYDLDYIIPKRLAKLGAMSIGGICIACSAIVFQTLTNNRILTPAIMGYEAAYVLLQALLILMMGTQSLVVLGPDGNFFVSMTIMLAYSWCIHRWLSRSEHADIYFLLLVGLVLTMMIGTVAQFIQVMISPGEFSVLLGYSQASFGRATPERLFYSGIIVLAVCIYLYKHSSVLDVLSLGREQAVSLGVDYPIIVKRFFMLIAVLVAVSTSLVGPTAFMGIFVANITYVLTGNFRHRATLPASCAVAIGIFIVAQFAVEHLFNYRSTVSILVNLICGVWFFILIVRARGAE